MSIEVGNYSTQFKKGQGYVRITYCIKMDDREGLLEVLSKWSIPDKHIIASTPDICCELKSRN